MVRIVNGVREVYIVVARALPALGGKV